MIIELEKHIKVGELLIGIYITESLRQVFYWDTGPDNKHIYGSWSHGEDGDRANNMMQGAYSQLPSQESQSDPNAKSYSLTLTLSSLCYSTTPFRTLQAPLICSNHI